MQGMQFTATSTVAENQMLSNSMYVHSIPSNNDNQDVVSMGTNAALITRRVIDNSFEVMAIHLMALLQATDWLDIRQKMSSVTGSTYDELRQVVPAFVEDKVKYPDAARLKIYLTSHGSKL
jgi:histidine ammonia-lyase